MNEFLTRNEEMVVGKFRLGAVVSHSLAGAVYETEFGDDTLPAVIRICEGEPAELEKLVERWLRVMDLTHPNLLQVYAAGTSVLNDVPIAYVVTERADESLAGVLAERALSEDETREMLIPAVAALKYLHKNGCAHGSLQASNVLAVGDRLKLSSDSVVPGGPAAEDMRALGVLIVQSLTRSSPKMEGDSDSYGLQEVWQAFTDIVRHCLEPDPEKRWTAEQVEARLNGPAPGPVLVEPGIAVPQPRPDVPGEQAETLRRTPRWIFVALAALILAVLLVAVLRKKDMQPAPAPAPQVHPEAPPVVAAPVVPRPRGRKADGWSVIVAAYGSQESAGKRMRELARKWPKFNITVLDQKTERARFLVVLGQSLSEDEAEALRTRAVEAGLPRDTYIKRVSEPRR